MSYTRDSAIRGHGTVSAEAVQSWFVSRGPAYKGYAPDGQYQAPPPNLGAAIVAECRRYSEHVMNHDLLAAQILHETAAWQSEYARERNNPGGIGAVNNNPDLALWFDTPEEGIRAHVAHMLNYVDGKGPWSINDPRGLPDGYYGVVDVLKDLEQRWAWSPPVEYANTPPDKRYGGMLAKHANALVAFANDGTWPMAAQIPGFTWVPADSDHFSKGRTQKIIGGAQHYSAGTNSLGHLTTSSNPPVSAHFLIHTNPTMEDRGYQLVRLEDTAWTTGEIVNPKVVAIEKEHLAGGKLDDMDYAVMAQTWVDIAAAVKALKLGTVPLTRTAIKGHNEWVGDSRVCPDGISVNRVVAEAAARAAMSVPEFRIVEVPGVGTFTVGGGFLRYWDTFGGLPVFGYPLTNERIEDGLTVQYFERAVFEHHPNAWPERWDVLLRRLGAQALAGAL